MSNIAEIITWKWNARPNVDFVVSNGVITRWAVEGVTKPTEAEVMAFEPISLRLAECRQGFAVRQRNYLTGCATQGALRCGRP